MKEGERQQRWHSVAVRAIALLGIPLLFYVGGRLAIDYVPSMLYAPCEYNDSFTLTAHGLEAFLLLVGVWLQARVFLRPSYALLIAALLVPTAAWLIQDVANDRDDHLQRQCAARPVAEALKACGANPVNYRQAKGPYGNDVLTMIASDANEKAWTCLLRWSYHNSKISFNIDESVH